VSRHPLRWLLPIQAVLLLVNPGLLPIWGDEQFTLNIVALSWGEIGAALAADIHPPLYFLLLKAWMVLSLADPIAWARIFSGLIAVSATVALDRLWMPRFSHEARTWFLALWCLSPLLLLDARMARSYSLQTLIAVLALAAMAHVCSQPSLKKAGILSVALAALLYTHYLPGLAIGAVAWGALAKKNVRLSLASAALTALLYLPWLPVLFEGLTQAAAKDVYRLAPSAVGELVLRLGYWFTAFSFGEAHGWITLTVSVLLGPWLLPIMLRGLSTDGSGMVRAGLMAAPVGLLGTWRWVAFAFTPARLLFLLPVFLLSLAVGVRENRDRFVLASVLALNLTGIGFYFLQYGYLNPGYLVPYGEIARQIEEYSPAADTLILVDAFNGDPKPLVGALGTAHIIVVAEGEQFVDRLELQLSKREPATVWRLGSTRDVSPNGLHQEAIERLEADYQLAESIEYLPYNSLQKSLFALFSGEDPPAAHFLVQRWERMPVQGAYSVR
jgi:hypothetical protein